MKKQADILRPKFEAVEGILEEELGGLGIGTWTCPKGGYFISFDSMDGCAKQIVSRCAKAGVLREGRRGHDQRGRHLARRKGSP